MKMMKMTKTKMKKKKVVKNNSSLLQILKSEFSMTIRSKPTLYLRWVIAYDSSYAHHLVMHCTAEQ